jgi:Secretion system C-terminal sorting domain
MANETLACPNFYFHLNFSGTRTFHIENSANPSDYIDVTGTGSISGWEFNSSLGNPCGMTFGSGICYTFYEVTAHITGDEKIAIQFTGGNPNHLTIDYDGINRTFSVSNPGDPSTYSITWGNDTDNPPACPIITCNSDYFILYNYLYQYNGIMQPTPTVTPIGYSTGYTLSDTFIYIAETSIPTGADVTLDANPLNDGYIQIEEGFETQPSSVFLAIVQTPCPSLSLNQNEAITGLTIYPNPVDDFVTVEAKDIIDTIEIIDLNGRVILTQKNNTTTVRINMETIAAGVYLLQTTTNENVTTQKIIKR